MITKKPIPFTKMRYFFFTLSSLLIAIGLGSLFFHPFNLGIDFTGGMDKQFQIAPLAFTVSAPGDEEVQIDINSRYLSVIYPSRTNEDPKRFALADYKTVQDLVTAVKQIPNMNIEVKPEVQNLPPTVLLALSFPVSVNKQPLVVNYFTTTNGVVAPIDAVRSALAPLGDTSLQYVGQPERQEYLLKIQVRPEKGQKIEDVKAGESEFLTQKDKQISDLLAAKFGKDSVMMKKTEYIGASFSIQLVKDAINAVILTLFLIVIYIALRFKFVYGIGAIIATVHDILFMIGVIAFFQLEVNSTVIAAILTIMGYSINDTIVVYDRMRENFTLMPNTARDLVIDTSITQSLSRTIITSLTTMLAILCVFIFATGSIKEFALNMIVGIVVGTYSSIFIAAPVVLGGMNMSDKRKGIKLGSATAPALTKPSKKGEDIGEEVEAVANAAVGGHAGPVEVVRDQVSRKQSKKKKK